MDHPIVAPHLLHNSGPLSSGATVGAVTGALSGDAGLDAGWWTAPLRNRLVTIIPGPTRLDGVGFDELAERTPQVVR